MKKSLGLVIQRNEKVRTFASVLKAIDCFINLTKEKK